MADEYRLFKLYRITKEVGVMKVPGLEELREILSDDRLHLAVGTVLSLELASDRAFLKVSVNVLPEETEMVCRMTWDAVGPNAGSFQFPSLNDMVMVGYLDGDEDEAFVLRRLTSKVDKIPIQAIDGHMVHRALGGKKLYLVSDTDIQLARGDADATEQLLLGNVFKTAYSSDLDATSKHKHIGYFYRNQSVTSR